MPDPSKRITIEEIQRHSWFTNGEHAPLKASASLRGDTAAVESHSGNSEPFDGVEEFSGDTTDDRSEPPSLNAFEVVNMFGGLVLHRLLSSTSNRTVYKYVCCRSAVALPACLPLTECSSSPQFISQLPVEVILRRLKEAFQEMGAETVVEAAAHKVKATVSSSRGEVVVGVVVYSMARGLHLVELTKRKVSHHRTRASGWTDCTMTGRCFGVRSNLLELA